MTGLSPVLSRHWNDADSFTITGYERHDGYKGLAKALAMSPDDVISYVKDSGLRGRGGAGFPTGMKWSFIPQGDNKPHYLVVNADESEPGTCKDMPLLLANPHSLVEGMIIASYAIRANHAFIYIRGEVAHVIRRVQQAVSDAYKAGYLGKNIKGSGFDLEMVVHVGAGAYICGEETALLDSLEGFRGQPRLRPPFPAIAGLYASPTVVNNVESIASVPAIMLRGKEWFQSLGTEKSKGFTLYSLSGHVVRPGQYEAPLGITLRELLDLSDIVTLHTPLNDDTRGMLGASEIARLKPGCIVVNVARGGLADEQALTEAVHAGRIKAAVDCFVEEPYTGALCDEPDVVLTAHMGSLTAETRTLMEVTAARQLVAELHKHGVL